jgi:hypothetical protein
MRGAACPSCQKKADSFVVDSLRVRGTIPGGFTLYGTICPHCSSLLGTAS